MFGNIYRNKRVLVTGHTGFKGSYLTSWLVSLGAKVTGYSAYLPSNPCHFEVCHLKSRTNHIVGDIRDFDRLRQVFLDSRPEFVFHLAAQPIVRVAYDDPKLTFETNVIGTVNVLECTRQTRGIRSAVIITSDKCYHNMEWPWGYRESDRLGGEDPYSASKACAEIACHTYVSSFFQDMSAGTRLATVRAGNVIGGGDWALDRIVPDCVRAWSEGKAVTIRNPQSTRPWQHVFEPLSGYLWVGVQLAISERFHGEAFNFGPVDNLNKSVEDLIKDLGEYWEDAHWNFDRTANKKKENSLLKLSCDKALHLLRWHPVLDFEETVRFTAEWYRAYYAGHDDMYDFTIRQIEEYMSKAQKQGLAWVEGKGIL
jgi:CDP-glucose 4,6-dehydratase